MKKLLSILAILLPTAVFAGNYTGVPYVSGPMEASQVQANTNALVTNINTYSTGLLFSLATPAATSTGTAEQILGTYILPASYLATTGQTLRLKATFAYAANTNNRTPKLYFGTASITGTVNATSSGTAMLTCDVVRSGSSTQTVACTGQNDTTPLIYAFTAGTDTDTATITIKATCTDGTSSAADCTLKTFTVESLR